MAKISPGVRSETADDSPLFTLSTKPRFYPESRDLPIITARQEIFSKKGGGGLSDRVSRRKSGKAKGVAWFEGASFVVINNGPFP